MPKTQSEMKAALLKMNQQLNRAIDELDRPSHNFDSIQKTHDLIAEGLGDFGVRWLEVTAELFEGDCYTYTFRSDFDTNFQSVFDGCLGTPEPSSNDEHKLGSFELGVMT